MRYLVGGVSGVIEKIFTCLKGAAWLTQSTPFREEVRCAGRPPPLGASARAGMDMGQRDYSNMSEAWGQVLGS